MNPVFGSPKCMKSLLDLIIVGFDWNDTPQGPTYWYEVYKNLEQIEKAVNASAPPESTT